MKSKIIIFFGVFVVFCALVFILGEWAAGHTMPVPGSEPVKPDTYQGIANFIMKLYSPAISFGEIAGVRFAMFIACALIAVFLSIVLTIFFEIVSKIPKRFRRQIMKVKLILCLAIILSGVLSGYSTTSQRLNWHVFYDCEKGPNHLSISREPHSLDFYTNGISEWNYDLRVPTSKINSVKVKALGEVNGLRAIEVRLSLTGIYYSDALMILEEMKPNQFLPVYVQDYNRDTRTPSENKISKMKAKLIIEAGMDYSGTGHFHNRYKIIISPNHDPSVIEP